MGEFCGRMVGGYVFLHVWLFLCLFQITPVCGIETLLYQFQCSTRHHSDSVEWQSIPVISVCFSDEYYGEL